MSVKAVAATKSIGVQCDKTLESKTGDISLDLTLKQVEMIVQKTVKKVLKHIYTPTLDTSQFQSVVEDCFEKILDKKRNQNLHVTRSNDNKSVPKYISLEVQEMALQSPVVPSNDNSIFKDSSSVPIISKIGPSHDEITLSKECITLPCSTSSIHIKPSKEDLPCNGPSVCERIVPSILSPAENDQRLDQSLSKCTSPRKSQNIPLPNKIITSPPSRKGIVNIPSIHIMPSNEDLPSGPSVCKRSVPSILSPAENDQRLDQSLSKCASPRKSQNVPLPNKIITSPPSRKGIVNIPSIHIMPSNEDLPSGPSVCKRSVPSILSPAENDQRLDQSLSKCASPRKSQNVPLPNKIITSPPSRKGIVNIPSIHIMPNKEDLPSGPSVCKRSVPSILSPAESDQRLDQSLSKCASPRKSQNVPLPNKIITSPPSRKGIVNIPSIHIMSSNEDLPSGPSVCKRSVPSISPAENDQRQRLDQSLSKCASPRKSQNVPLPNKIITSPPSRKGIVNIPSIHIMSSNEDLPSNGPSVCERSYPSISPAESDQRLDQSLSKCASPRKSQNVPLPNKIITTPPSRKGIVNIPSIHIMPSNEDLPSNGPSVCERSVPSISPAENDQTLAQSLSKCASPRKSQNVPLPNRIITSPPSRKGIVNIPSIHIMSSNEDLPSGPSVCKRSVPSISPAENDQRQRLDQSLFKCTSPRKSQNIPLLNKIITTPPSRQGIVNIPSIHIMPSNEDLPSNGPSVCERSVPSILSPAENDQRLDQSLSKCASPRKSQNVPLPNKIITSPPSRKGIVNIPSIHIMSSNEDLPSGPSVCKTSVPSISPAENDQRQRLDQSLFKCTSPRKSQNIPLLNKIITTPPSRKGIVNIPSIHIMPSNEDLPSNGPSVCERSVPSILSPAENDQRLDQSLSKCASPRKSQNVPLPNKIITSPPSRKGIVNIPSIHIMPNKEDLPSGPSVCKRSVPSILSPAESDQRLDQSLSKCASPRKSQNVPLPNKIITTPPSRKGIVNIPSIHIMPSNEDLPSNGPSVCERSVPSISLAENDQTLDQSLSKCASPRKSQNIPLLIITTPPSRKGIVNIPSIHIMPSNEDLPSNGPSVCERSVPSISLAENDQTLDQSLSKCASPRKSQNIPLLNKIITTPPSRKGIVNIPSIHIMSSNVDLPSGPSVCKRSVPSILSPAENDQRLDQSLSKCASPRKSQNVPLPNKIITSPPSRKGIVNIPSIHIMPSNEDLPSNGPSVCERSVPSISPAENDQKLDQSLSKCTSPRKSQNVPLPNKIITSPPSRKGIINIPSIHIMSSNVDLPSNGPSVCEKVVPSHSVPLISWHSQGHCQLIISSALNCHMNQTSSGVRPSLQSLFQSERDHQNGTHNCTHWYVINNYLRDLFIPGALIICIQCC